MHGPQGFVNLDKPPGMTSPTIASRPTGASGRPRASPLVISERPGTSTRWHQSCPARA